VAVSRTVAAMPASLQKILSFQLTLMFCFLGKFYQIPAMGAIRSTVQVTKLIPSVSVPLASVV